MTIKNTAREAKFMSNRRRLREGNGGLKSEAADLIAELQAPYKNGAFVALNIFKSEGEEDADTVDPKGVDKVLSRMRNNGKRNGNGTKNPFQRRASAADWRLALLTKHDIWARFDLLFQVFERIPKIEDAETRVAVTVDLIKGLLDRQVSFDMPPEIIHQLITITERLPANPEFMLHKMILLRRLKSIIPERYNRQLETMEHSGARRTELSAALKSLASAERRIGEALRALRS